MSTVTVLTISLFILFIAYHTYGRFIANRIVQPNNEELTAAHKLQDDFDYSPAHKIFSWCNHFASIAGAGPIIGPILGVAFFGWGPTLLWLLIGSIFIGGIHDYLLLMLSARNDGKGLAEIAEGIFGINVKNVIGILIYLLTVSCIACFMLSIAGAFVNKPQLVIPGFGIIIIAVFMGLTINKLNYNTIIVGFIGIAISYFLLYLGYLFPISFPGHWNSKTVITVWCMILTGYCYFASISPIWLVLRPRDLISSSFFFVGTALALLGIIIVAPTINAPFMAEKIVHVEPTWPILFVIVACGAISGFHALVSSGTTSKQLNKETDGKIVGYGSMLAESAIAIIVVLLVTGGLKWGLAPQGISATELNQYFGSAIMQKGWFVTFATAYGNVVSGMNIPYLIFPIAALLGATMISTFVMTTLDTGTRLSRLIITGTFGNLHPLFKNNHFATLITLTPAFLLAITGNYIVLWELFGSANQMVASVALLLVSIILIRNKRHYLPVIIPGIFMLITSFSAIVYKTFNMRSGYLRNPEGTDYILGILSIILLIISIVIIIKCVQFFKKLIRAKRLNL